MMPSPMLHCQIGIPAQNKNNVFMWHFVQKIIMEGAFYFYELLIKTSVTSNV